MKCRCGNEVEQVRIDLLGSDKCAACAKRVGTPKVKGIMIWEHKTAPSIQVVSPEACEMYKKDTYRKGQMSILRTKMGSSNR